MELVKELDGHVDGVWQVCWSGDGKRLASCGVDRTIDVYVWENGDWRLEEKIVCARFRKSVRSIEFSPDSRYLGGCGFDGVSVIWERIENEWREMYFMEGHENEVKCIRWIQRGEQYMIATCGRDKSVWIWELDREHSLTCISLLQEHEQDVKMVAWKDWTLLASCSYDNSVILWKEDVDGDWIRAKTLAHGDTVWAIEFSRCGNWLGSCCADSKMYVWECDGWTCMACVVVGDGYPLYSISWSVWNEIAVAGGDGTVWIYGIVGTELEMMGKKEEMHRGEINCIQWHPRERWIVSCGDDTMVRIWRVDLPFL